MVEVRNLSLVLSGRKVLEDVSFTLRPGEVTILLGTNGAGKTSLLRCMSSYYRNYRGNILFDGTDLRRLGSGERKAAHAIMPQILPSVDILLEDLVASAELASPFSSPGPDARSKADEVIGKLGLEHLKGRPVSRMSGGERQLSFLAFLMAHDAGLYILDEPGSHLDAIFSRKVESVISSFHESGKCMLAAMHDMEQAFRIADRLLVLDGGRLVFDGTKEDFISRDIHGRFFSMELRRLRDEEGMPVLSFR